jgi:hypothetical protein
MGGIHLSPYEEPLNADGVRISSIHFASPGHGVGSSGKIGAILSHVGVWGRDDALPFLDEAFSVT